MRIDQLTITRFFAAILIVIFHYGTTTFPFNIAAFTSLFKQANIGVNFFFLLSGFVMVIAYGNKEKIEFTDYIKKRLARIYPVYILAIIILLSYFIAFHEPVDYKELALSLTMLQSWIPVYALSFCEPAWSLSVEMFFYFSFPFIFNRVYQKYSIQKIVIFVLLFFISSQIISHVLMYSSFFDGNSSFNSDLIWYFPLIHFNAFIIGNITGLFFLKGIKRGNYDFPIIILVCTVSYILNLELGISYHNGMMSFIFVPLILLISANNGLLTRISKLKPFVFLGEISYGIYILQYPIMVWVYKLLENLHVNDPTPYFYSYLLVLMVFSGLSYKYFETPLRRIINGSARTRNKKQTAESAKF